MYMKIHKKGENKIVAVCDAELIEECLKEGGTVLDIKKYSDFYKGNKVCVGEVAEALEDYLSLNLVGEKAVGCAIDKGIITKEQVILISGKPHVQIYLIK